MTHSVPSTFLVALALLLPASGLAAETAENRLLTPVSASKADDEVATTRAALAATPDAEDAAQNLVDALVRAGRKREALAEADRFAEKRKVGVQLRAQRAFLRRDLNDWPGASADFTDALAGEGLSPDQRRNVEAGLAEVQASLIQSDLDLAQRDLTNGKFADASDRAQVILSKQPASAPAMMIRVDALSRGGKKRAALAEANQFVTRASTNTLLRAQRGYLRRELNDVAGAINDFEAALATSGLSAEQRSNVEAALAEARGAQKRSEIVPAPVPSKEQMFARGQAPGWAHAERGFARRKAGDVQGAKHDFDAALAKKDINRNALPSVRYARAEAAATLAEADGDPLKAEASYREYLETEPAQADGWYKLGYLMLSQQRPEEGADALNRGLALQPVATAYLDSANAYILTNAPMASRNYRAGLDRWYAGDKSLSARSAMELERVKNEVVQADASIRTNISAGGIGGRPTGGGGTNHAGGIDTRVRFDGRYLPAISGLEAFARGLTDKDAVGERETSTGAGLRYRPLANLNFYVGGMIDHSYQPKSETEFVALWGLGLGSDAYPYVTGWQPYWDAGTFGSWHTTERRVLQDTRGNIGFLYDMRAPVRAAIGPTLLAVASYDSLASTPWAAGIGPSLLSYVWLGGDKYRSFDAMLTFQVGYLINVGADQRQRGWRGQISVTF